MAGGERLGGDWREGVWSLPEGSRRVVEEVEALSPMRADVHKRKTHQEEASLFPVM